MHYDLRARHQQMAQYLAAGLVGNDQRLRVKKKTVSNLFRYDGRRDASARWIDLSHFNQPLFLDAKALTLEVQGLATYEHIVDFVLPHGLLPLVTPELKHITVGGATVGIGIETNSYRYGFVHDGLLEADVLLPDGRVVLASSDNQYSDLFFGLPNSYGTLGYILRAKIKLRSVKPFVHLQTVEYTSSGDLLQAMEQAAADEAVEYVESLIYSSQRLYLTTARATENASKPNSIYGSNIFYKQISRPGEVTLAVKDYLFRFDPEWFWNIPETPPLNLFRRLAPPALRNSAFYARYNQWETKRAAKRSSTATNALAFEALIQDWEAPWPEAKGLLDFALKNIDLDQKPLMAAPLKTPALATSYPMQPNQLYLNLGSYSYVKQTPAQAPYHHTKIMDKYCFEHGGIKMLYSSTFLDEPSFNKLYSGQAYATLKAKYDPQKLLPTLYQKAVSGL